MKPLYIDPADVWMFRDGKPFDADSGHRAASHFPPMPSVLQGMLRTTHLARSGVNLNDKQAVANAVGTATDFKSLALRGPFVREKDTLLLPLPADVYQQKDLCFARLELHERATLERRQENASQAVTHSHTLLSPAGVEPHKFRETLVSGVDFARYLAGQPFSARTSDKLWRPEERMGNGIDNALQTTREGRLFQVQYLRFAQEVGLYAELVTGLWHGDPAALNVITAFGGERRQAHVYEPKAALSLPPKTIGGTNVFKLVFLTPTVFDGGWQPKTGGWNAFFNLQANENISLMSAALPKFQNVGGFDVARQAHKSALRFVPAGSVYFFQRSGADASRAITLARDWVCDDVSGTEWGRIGYGQVAMADASGQCAN